MADVSKFSPDGGTTTYNIVDTTSTKVSTWNGRSGSVLPMAGDYDATQIDYDAHNSMKDKIDEVAGVWTSPVSCLVGDSTCTITNENINTTSVIDIYYQTASGEPIAYSSAVVTNHTIVITFDSELIEAATIKLLIHN